MLLTGVTRKRVAGGVAPSNTVAPSISGVQIVGQTLTGTDGTWTGTPTITYTYQWQRSTDGGTNWSDISGATSITHVIQAAGAGSLTRLRVRANNGIGGNVDAFSNTLSIRATILDIYSSNVERCYYLTLQRGAYYGSPCIRVRRSSDNAEQNIGFTTSGALDTAALLSFVGAGNGFIVTYFDQSTNARHATQTTPSKQAQIVSSGAIMTNGGLTITDYVSASAQGDYSVTSVNLSTYTLYHYNIVIGGVARGVTGTGAPRPLYHTTVGDGFRNAATYVTIRSVGSGLIKRAYSRNSNNGTLYYDGVSQGTSAVLETTNNAFNGYMSNAFGTYTTEDVRGSIVYSIDHNAATIAAISNLLD